MRRVGAKRGQIWRDKKEDLEIKPLLWQDGRNVLSRTYPPTWFSSHFDSVEDAAKHAQQSTSSTVRTPQPQPPPYSTTGLVAFLFSHPFISCHSKCYSQLVKVHYTLSSWPEIYTPQCLRRVEEGCNPLTLMTVHVSWWNWWILWFFSMWIYIIEYYCTKLTLSSCNRKIRCVWKAAARDSSALLFKRGKSHGNKTTQTMSQSYSAWYNQ